MDQRKATVLQFVVENYVARVAPVASRTVARQLPLGISSATIRNEMADLEELGYLLQPHTSAGRIPSDKGYRFYVDYLMGRLDLTPEEIDLIRRTYERKAREVEWVVQQAARLISEITNYASVVVGPSRPPGVCRGLKVVPLAVGRALLVVMGDRGYVESRCIEVPPDLGGGRLSEIGRILSDHFSGQPFFRIQREMLAEVYRQLRQHREVLDACFAALEGLVSEEEHSYVVGAGKILEQPEFQDLGKAKELLALLGGAIPATELFAGNGGGAITLLIGAENTHPEIRDCTLVSLDLPAGGWKLVVLGPKRMAYNKVVTTMEYLADQLKEVLGA